MMEGILIVVVCVDCGAFWYPPAESPRCVDPSHAHRRADVHRHLRPVTLADRTIVTAASFDPHDPYARVEAPDFGLYLDPHWDPPWDHESVDWPDFGVPHDVDALLEHLTRLLARARSGQRVEVGCLGGHGRTGTVLACLSIMAGVAPRDAVSWVRRSYCSEAVETTQQEGFVASFGRVAQPPVPP